MSAKSVKFPQKPKVYRERKLTAEEKDNPEIEYVEIASTDDPIPRKKEIEADSIRGPLESGTGNVCIGISVGDETIGDIGMTVQFEGPVNAHDECMKGHNKLLVHTSEHLIEILNQMFPDLDWDGQLESLPCDKTSVKVAVLECMRLLEKRSPDREVNHELKRERQI
ncbi:hypothetical protein JXA32_05520 [Candidatus Sumerlaeota bacterium]|nr:hypothetical protein [Candidatus Sumerlaeota bacterium]